VDEVAMNKKQRQDYC